MTNFLVVERPEQWPLEIPSAEVVSAVGYLTEPRFSEMKRARIYNFCDSYRYQSEGYYVSLLATARGHRALPSVMTIQDMKSRSLIRPADDLEELIQRSLREIQSTRFELSIYFGRNLAERHSRLARALYNLFPVPLMRASFAKTRRWRLQSLGPIPVGDLPASHREFLHTVIGEHFAGRGPMGRTGRSATEYDLAILANNEERSPPSDREALKKFARAGRALGFNVEFLGRDDYGRIAEFDALFIRETTNVNHHTYRFASRARAEGLVVIDDPESIIRCSNKVYLVELARRLDIPIPPTRIVASTKTAAELVRELGLPCVLKQPDSAFSEGVFRADTEEELAAGLAKLLARSDLVVAQAFTPTEFDWRVGVINREPLFVCRYYMAEGHWQIYKHGEGRRAKEGAWETLRLDEAPAEVVDLALKASNAIGDGFYGVDIKTVDGRPVLIEVNDNPNVDTDVEDRWLGDALYEQIIKVFRARLDAGRQSRTG